MKREEARKVESRTEDKAIKAKKTKEKRVR